MVSMRFDSTSCRRSTITGMTVKTSTGLRLRSMDVLDYLNSAEMRLRLYRIDSPPPVAAELAGYIVQQSDELAKGVSLLEQNQRVLEHCVEVHRLENEADRVSRNAIAELFDHESDPIRLIKMTELYEVLETATDKAEDAANVLEQSP